MLPKRLLLAMLAFVLAGIGQSLLSGPLKMQNSLIYGGIAYAIAAVLFIVAFRRVAVAQFALGRLSGTTDTAITRRLSRLRWVLLILAVVAMVGSLVLFSEPTSQSSAWNLHIAS